MKYLTPFVNWGQNVDTVYIKIDLKDAEARIIKYSKITFLIKISSLKVLEYFYDFKIMFLK